MLEENDEDEDNQPLLNNGVDAPEDDGLENFFDAAHNSPGGGGEAAVPRVVVAASDAHGKLSPNLSSGAVSLSSAAADSAAETSSLAAVAVHQRCTNAIGSLVSPKFHSHSQLQSMKKALAPSSSKKSGDDDGFSYQNMMGMMMMQQKVEHKSLHEDREFQMQQANLEHEERYARHGNYPS